MWRKIVEIINRDVLSDLFTWESGGQIYGYKTAEREKVFYKIICSIDKDYFLFISGGKTVPILTFKWFAKTWESKTHDDKKILEESLKSLEPLETFWNNPASIPGSALPNEGDGTNESIESIESLPKRMKYSLKFQLLICNDSADSRDPIPILPFAPDTSYIGQKLILGENITSTILEFGDDVGVNVRWGAVGPQVKVLNTKEVLQGMLTNLNIPEQFERNYAEAPKIAEAEAAIAKNASDEGKEGKEGEEGDSREDSNDNNEDEEGKDGKDSKDGKDDDDDGNDDGNDGNDDGDDTPVFQQRKRLELNHKDGKKGKKGKEGEDSDSSDDSSDDNKEKKLETMATILLNDGINVKSFVFLQQDFPNETSGRDQGSKDEALLLSSVNGKDGMVKAILNGGVDIDAADKEGLTPLMHAAKDGHKAVALGLNVRIRTYL